MRRYETVWVVNGDLPDEEIKATIDKFTKIITGQGGTLVSVEEWGRRKLAYKIEGTLRGYYIIADFAGLPAAVKELERNYRIDDRVIRYLTMKKADQVDVAALEAEIAAKAQEAARRTAEAEKAAAEAAAMEAAAATPPEAPPAEAEAASPPAEEKPTEAEPAAAPEKEK
ncbi:MAG: 30S ribosomal protein S6 [Syntrophobacterales bacterium]|jgi:small subunit ribosomal protein S6